MKRPSKKEIREAIEKLKEKPSTSSTPEQKVGELSTKKSSQRIRKQGI